MCFGGAALGEHCNETVAFPTVHVIAEAIHEALQAFLRRLSAVESGERAFFQLCHRVSEQDGRHLRLASRKVVVKAGFAEACGGRKLVERGTFEAAGLKHAGELCVEQSFGLDATDHAGQCSETNVRMGYACPPRPRARHPNPAALV